MPRELPVWRQRATLASSRACAWAASPCWPAKPPAAARAAARAAGGAVIETHTKEEAVAVLRAELRAGDVALLKGSNGLAMFDIVDALVAGQPA